MHWLIRNNYSTDVIPKCSKLYFGDKALEKTVRMKDSMGIMMERFKNLNENVENTLKTMMEEFDAMKLQVKENKEVYKQKLIGKICIYLYYIHSFMY